MQANQLNIVFKPFVRRSWAGFGQGVVALGFQGCGVYEHLAIALKSVKVSLNAQGVKASSNILLLKSIQRPVTYSIQTAM